MSSKRTSAPRLACNGSNASEYIEAREDPETHLALLPEGARGLGLLDGHLVEGCVNPLPYVEGSTRYGISPTRRTYFCVNAIKQARFPSLILLHTHTHPNISLDQFIYLSH